MSISCVVLPGAHDFYSSSFLHLFLDYMVTHSKCHLNIFPFQILAIFIFFFGFITFLISSYSSSSFLLHKLNELHLFLIKILYPNCMTSISNLMAQAFFNFLCLTCILDPKVSFMVCSKVCTREYLPN